MTDKEKHSHNFYFMVVEYSSFQNQEALPMESRDIGIGIVMIIPSFVGSGALWHLFHNWIAVFIWLIVMVCVYGGILKKKYS